MIAKVAPLNRRVSVNDFFTASPRINVEIVEAGSVGVGWDSRLLLGCRQPEPVVTAESVKARVELGVSAYVERVLAGVELLVNCFLLLGRSDR